WSHLRVVNLNLARGTSPAEMIGYLNEQAETKTSAVLLEKLGDLQLTLQKPDLAIEAWDKALANHPTPQQRIRLLSARAEQLTQLERNKLALADWKLLLELLPPSPERTRAEQRRNAVDAKVKAVR
ncbi:MAG: hypothetical protein EB034_23230, partial [Verrucomicrobia bacterium]|nr:hypothetical protein [Verrucomicrobiota bacterium]